MYVGLSDYLNDQDVRTALHIPAETQAWEECNSAINEGYFLTQEASLWIYDILRRAGMKMLFYSGETDGAIATEGTKKWIKDLNWPITKEWAAWNDPDTMQTNGWTIEYASNFTFTSVKGVGHMAPQWARKPVLDMVNDFIA